MILVVVELDAIDQSRCPFYYEGFETILLVEVSVHVLFHCLSCHSRIFTFLVKLNFLRIHVLDRIFQLFKG